MKLPKGFELVSDEAPTKSDNFNLPEGFELIEEPKKGIKRAKEPFSIPKALEKMKRPFTQEDPGVALATQRPGTAAAGYGLGIVEPFEQIANLTEPGGLINALNPGRSKSLSNVIEGNLTQDLPEEQKKAFEKLKILGNLTPIETLVSSLIPKNTNAINPSQILGPEKSPIKPRQLGRDIPTSGQIDPYSAMIAEREAAGIARDAQETLLPTLPPSRFEAAEEAASSLVPKVEGRPIGTEAVLSPSQGGRSLVGRVTEVPGPGSAISPVEFQSSAQGGRALNNRTRDLASTERSYVTRAYNAAEQNYRNINSIADNTLLEDLNSEIDRLRESARPNTAERSVLTSLEEIRDYYIARNGVPVRQLIKTSDSISGMANYELPFNGPKDILKRVANTLDRAAIRAIENNGGDADLLRSANRRYSRWANRFGNDDIRPYLERTINNPEGLFDKAIKDPGAFRAVERALGPSRTSTEYTNALARKIAENLMKGFTGKNLDKVGSKDYFEQLRNLRDLIGPRRASEFDRALRREQRMSFKERAAPAVRQKSPVVQSRTIQRLADRGAKTLGLRSPEEVLNKLKTRSGIRELRDKLPKESFDKLIEAEAKSILNEHKIYGETTGQKLFEVLNKEHNFEIFSEILGKEEAKELLDYAKHVGRKEITEDRIISLARKGFKKAINATIAAKALKIILGLVV